MKIDQIKKKDMEIKMRVNHILKINGWNKSEMARRMKVSPNYLNSVLTNSFKGFSATMFKGFAEIGINLNWLLTGKGEALILNEDYKDRAEKAEARINELENDLNTANILSKELKSWIIGGNFKRE